MMKKIILSFFLGVIFSGLCQAQNGFHVTGDVQRVPAGKLYLVVERENKVDTLGMAFIRGERFEFSGRVDCVEVAQIRMVGRNGGIQFMLENAEIRVKIDENGVSVEGGEEQALYYRYMEFEKVMNEVQALFQKQGSAEARQGRQMEMLALQQRVEKAMREADKGIVALMKAEPDCVATAYMLYKSIGRLTPEELQERYGWLGERARESVCGEVVGDYLAAREQVAEGAIAPDFTVATPQGDSLSLHSVRAKLKLVSFWASWNAPGRRENTNLINLFRKFQPVGLQIISISMDTNDQAWKRAIGEDGMTWLNGSDLRGEGSPLLSLYFITELPHTILLDEENRIIATGLLGNDLWKKVNELLKKKK